MPKPLGETFPFELHAAGFTKPLTWDGNGNILNSSELSTEELAQLDAIIAAHDPLQERPVEKTDAEQLLDALIAESIIPAAKRAAIVARLPVRVRPPRPVLPTLPVVPF
jgi:hypothetical protein